MTRSGAEIRTIESGEELVEVWNEIDFRPPGGDEALPMWQEVVGAGRHDFLVARLGGRAVGSVFVKRDGPVMAEKAVFEAALLTEFPHQQPISIIYQLRVKPEQRGKRIGWDLTEAAEQSIIDMPDAVPRAALSVTADNSYALRIYENSGYEKIPFKGEYAVLLDHPDETGTAKSMKPVYLMTKDLSGFRKPA